MNLKYDLSQINLLDFLIESISDGEELMSPNVFSLTNPKEIDLDALVLESAEELYQQLVENRSLLYVNFSASALDSEIECIDGNTYLYLSEEDAEEYFEEEEEMPENFQPYENQQIDEDSSVGYILTNTDGKVQIQSAIFQATKSSIEITDHLEIFDAPMDDYLKKYIK